MAGAAEDVTTTCIPCLRQGLSCQNQCTLRQFFHEDDPQSVDNFETIFKTHNMLYIRMEVEARLPDEARARTFINCLLKNCEYRKIDPVDGAKGVYDRAQLRVLEAQQNLYFTIQSLSEILLDNLKD